MFINELYFSDGHDSERNKIQANLEPPSYIPHIQNSKLVKTDHRMWYVIKTKNMYVQYNLSIHIKNKNIKYTESSYKVFRCFK
jgi:hypothetical protein